MTSVPFNLPAKNYNTLSNKMATRMSYAQVQTDNYRTSSRPISSTSSSRGSTTPTSNFDGLEISESRELSLSSNRALTRLLQKGVSVEENRRRERYPSASSRISTLSEGKG